MQHLKLFLLSFLLILSLSFFINAGDAIRGISQQKVLPMQGLNLQSLNSYGFNSGIIFDLSSAANSNPASVFSNHTFAAAVSYQYKILAI